MGAQPVEAALHQRVRAAGELALRITLPELELCERSGLDAGRHEPIEAGALPVDRVDSREHLESVLEHRAALVGRGLGEEARARVGRRHRRHLAVDEAHHEERGAEHGRVGLDADERRERYARRRGCEPPHRAPLDLDLHVEPGRLHRVDGGLGHLAAQDESLGALVAAAERAGARVDAQRLGRVAAREPGDLAHGDRGGGQLRGEPARERRAPGVGGVRHGARS
jgi:hypothetical protein